MLSEELKALAQAYGIELSYFDIEGHRYDASLPALQSLLPQLGAEFSVPTDAAAALKAKTIKDANEVAPPVMVAWAGSPAVLSLKFPAKSKPRQVQATLQLENGEEHEISSELAGLPVQSFAAAGDEYLQFSLRLPEMPLGYHHIDFEYQGSVWGTLVISAPRQAPAFDKKRWGVFAPTYSLRGDHDDGLGGLRELGELMDFVFEHGGHYVGTLPLTAVFLRELFAASPYASVSRLFWNEAYLDLRDLPDLDRSLRARSRLLSQDFQKQSTALDAQDKVDWAAQAALRRTVLQPLAEDALKGGGRGEFERRLVEDKDLGAYARFRAMVEKTGKPWHAWDPKNQHGELSDSDVDPNDFAYHVYVQCRMQDQLTALSERAKARDGGLYLDLPLGVHPDGFDAWRYADCFVPRASTGAPPDGLFALGQDWGFRPLNPQSIRQQGYSYVRASLNRQLALSSALRIDHVMGLHRLFCIPHGVTGKEGVYLQYEADELYAILTLEAHRNNVPIVGEDLGTVPDRVREAMNEHRLHRMYVMQFALHPDRHDAIDNPPDTALATVGTHDTPTFAAFWEGKDIDLRVELGHQKASERDGAHAGRGHMRNRVIETLRQRHMLGGPTETKDVLGGCHNLLASSAAPVVMVNLEDLWCAPDAQNVPGTMEEHPNWQRRAQYGLSELKEVPGLLGMLKEVSRRRRED